MSLLFCDQSCKYLNISEDEQNRRRDIGIRERIAHKCKILRDGKLEILIHGKYHPELLASDNCYLRNK